MFYTSRVLLFLNIIFFTSSYVLSQRLDFICKIEFQGYFEHDNTEIKIEGKTVFNKELRSNTDESNEYFIYLYRLEKPKYIIEIYQYIPASGILLREQIYMDSNFLEHNILKLSIRNNAHHINRNVNISRKKFIAIRKDIDGKLKFMHNNVGYSYE